MHNAYKTIGFSASAIVLGSALPGLAIAPALAATAYVGVLPFAKGVSSAQPLLVGIGIAGGSTVAQGSVVLTAGAFRSNPVSLFLNTAVIIVPAGVLPNGTDTLTVQYTPRAGSPYSAGSGTASIPVSSAALPRIATQVFSLSINGDPFSAIRFGDGLLVSTSADPSLPGSQTGVENFNASGPSGFAYRCTIPVANGVTQAFGTLVTPDRRGLLVAAENDGLDVAPAIAARYSCADRNTLVSQGALAEAEGSFDVAVTPDSRFAFVAKEYGVIADDSQGKQIEGNVGVVELTRRGGGATIGGKLIGEFSTGGNTIANVTVSPNGRRLYVTSEADQGVKPSGASNPALARDDCTTTTVGDPTAKPSLYGLLTVVDVAKIEANPSDPSAILVQEAAGCSPVRVVETSDDEILWVAARGENEVLAFSTQMLESDPEHAFLGSGNTGGIAPVGLQLFDGGRLLAIANSDRFAMPAVPGNLAIMRATPVSPEVVTTLSASLFPRNISVAKDDSTLYLTNFYGASVQIIKTMSNDE